VYKHRPLFEKMLTKNQLISDKTTRRYKRKKGTRSRIPRNRPQRKGIRYKVTTMKPKKPNSSNRKIAKVRLLFSRRRVTCSISGQGHNLRDSPHASIRGGRIPDLPGVQYRMIKGTYDYPTYEAITRIYGRSKYGLEKMKPEDSKAYKEGCRTHIERKKNMLEIR
jgi:small subunit ribosomal protein S12